MAYSLVNELKKIQIAKSCESSGARSFNSDIVQKHGSVRDDKYNLKSSGKPLSSCAAKLHNTEGFRKSQSLLKVRIKPSPPSIPRLHGLERVRKQTSEDFGVRRNFDFRSQADGDSVCSLEVENGKERAPGDGCNSESDREELDKRPTQNYADDNSSSNEEETESETDDCILSHDGGNDDGQEEIDEYEDIYDGESICSADESLESASSTRVVLSSSTVNSSERPRVKSARIGLTGSGLMRKKSWAKEKLTTPPYPLLSSLFVNVPPTIYFTLEGEEVSPFPQEIRKALRWKLSTITPKVIKGCIARSGFKTTKKNIDWLSCWGKHMKAASFKTLKEFQKLNHFPGTFQVGRKDRLWRNFSKMQILFGRKEFNFLPQTYILPHDLRQLKKAWEDGGSKQKWIIKPPASARGIGIKVIHKWSQLPRKRAIVVQRYLSKPYLINGSKFDIRTYVYVTSFDPLRIYIFDDGLVRFATSKYSSSSKTLSNKYMHLTNYSINKKNVSSYTPNFDEKTCQGHKWSLKSLWQYLKKRGVDTEQLWKTIKDLSVKTIICAESSVNTMVKQNVKSRFSCHELFGFDIIFDEHLKPWLLEVNISPSLHSNSTLDAAIKGQLVKDMLNLTGFRIPKCVLTTSFLRNFEVDQMAAEKIWFEQFSLTPDEKYKHAYFTQRRVDESVKGTILDLLTPDDIRILMESDDELSRCGNFQRIFPSTASDKYLKFFDTPRYYNMLLDEWTKKYWRDARCPAAGIALLLSYSKRGLHLGATDDPAHQWGSVRSQMSAPTRSISAPAQLLEGAIERAGGSSAALPSIRKKKKASLERDRSIDRMGIKRGSAISAHINQKVSAILQNRTKL